MALKPYYLHIKNEFDNKTIEDKINLILEQINPEVGESFTIFPMVYDLNINRTVQPILIYKYESDQSNI